MENITITLTVQATQDEAFAFATSRGYQPLQPTVIQVLNTQTGQLETTTTVPTDQEQQAHLVEFVTTQLKSDAVNVFSVPARNQVYAASQQQQQAAINQINESLSNRINVEVTN